MLRLGLRCSRPSLPRPSSTAPRRRRLLTSGPANESYRRPFQHCRDRRRGLLLPCRYGRVVALPRCVEPPARADQGGQSRSRPRRAWPLAPFRKPARRAQARRHLGAGAIGGSHRRAARRTRGAAQRNGRMSVLQALDICLALLVFAVAAWTIFAPGAFAATVGYVVYGLLLSLVWIRLFAVDVALTEAAIGSGVTGILLIGAAARLRGAEAGADEKQPSGLARLAIAALCILVALALAAVVLLFADQGPSLAPQAMRHLPEIGLGNPVTAVLIAYRAFDTMLEKVVLVLAVVGVWSLAADRYWGGAPGEARSERPEPTLAFLAQVLAPLGVLVGIHVFWVGADAPGGAFQGGAILAAMWIIVMMARLTEAPQTNAVWVRLAIVAGPL